MDFINRRIMRNTEYKHHMDRYEKWLGEQDLSVLEVEEMRREMIEELQSGTLSAGQHQIKTLEVEALDKHYESIRAPEPSIEEVAQDFRDQGAYAAAENLEFRYRRMQQEEQIAEIEQRLSENEYPNNWSRSSDEKALADAQAKLEEMGELSPYWQRLERHKALQSEADAIRAMAEPYEGSHEPHMREQYQRLTAEADAKAQEAASVHVGEAGARQLYLEQTGVLGTEENVT